MKRNSYARFAVILLIILFVVLIIPLIKQIGRRDTGEPSKDDNNLIATEDESKEIPVDNGITIVVDPGHGGRDPGKIGVNGALEKDVNLSISLKLRKHLEDNGYNVIMTREEDIGLYKDSDSNKKNADLRKRVDIINNSNASLAISIHQNSFEQESSRGAQVFYYGNSIESEVLANIIQEQIKIYVQPDNKRLAKAETSYYMLKNTKCPIVIIECGFLSNNEEASLLIDDDYQDKMAEAIYRGLDTYINVKD